MNLQIFSRYDLEPRRKKSNGAHQLQEVRW